MSKRKSPAASPAASRADGWENTLTGQGTLVDKRRATVPVVRRMTAAMLENYWRADWMAARIIEKPADMMTQKGADVLIGDGDKEAQEQIGAVLDELDSWPTINRAVKYARAYGLGAVFMGVEDGLDPRLPLDFKALQRVAHLTAIPQDELTPATNGWYSDPLKPRFGEVETWRWMPRGTPTSASVGGVELHESRLLVFRGRVTSVRQLAENQGAGDSVLQVITEIMADFASALGGAGALVQEFGAATLEMEDLAKYLQSTDGKQRLRDRVEAMKMARSAIGVTLLGKGEKYTRENTPVTGLPELVQLFAQSLGAAADMPFSLMFGEGPSGLNADGQSDIDNWHEHIDSRRETDLRKPANRLVQAILRSKQGPTGGEEPEKWTVRFRPLRQMTQVQVATLRKTVADTDALYIQNGVLSPAQVARSRFGGPEWSAETQVDAALLDVMEANAAAGEMGTPEGEGA